GTKWIHVKSVGEARPMSGSLQNDRHNEESTVMTRTEDGNDVSRYCSSVLKKHRCM
ncbi:hypothetical protein L9F63_015889, partial [Diploptera punctata]